jgi:nucleoside-diphosphate-sugar epimerase
MKIFITGSSGFVGSHLLQRLLRRGEDEVAILLRNPGVPWRLDSIPDLSNAHIIQGSLDEVNSYKDKLKYFSPDIIVNLAWDGVQGSNRNSNSQWDNVVNLLELIKIGHVCGVKKFIGFGSQGEYGNLNKKISENDYERPTTLYGISKLSACHLGKVVASQLGVKFVWIRLFDPYGPKDGSTWFLPYIIKELLEGRSPKITKAEQLWDYIYIDDAIDAIVKIIDKDDIHGIFNLGSGQSIELRKIINTVKNLINPNLDIQFGAVSYREDQIMHLESNINKISNEIEWTPSVEIDKGLKKTIDWLKSNLDNGPV